MFFPGYYHWHLFDLFVMNSRLVEQPANTTIVFSFSSFVPQTATLEIDNHLLTCSQLNAKLVPKNKQEVLTPQIQTFTLHVHPSIKLISYWIHCGRENTWNSMPSFSAFDSTNHQKLRVFVLTWFGRKKVLISLKPGGQLQKSGGGFFLHDHKILNTGLTRLLNYPQFLIAKRKQTA